MSGLSTDEDLTHRNTEERDKLTRIRGIGPTKQQWLDLLGIRTVRDLAGASADELESQLRTRGHTVSRSEVEGWIARSRELAADLSSQQTVQSCYLLAEESQSFQQMGNSAGVEAENSLSPSVEEGEWRTLASFAVKFQTRQVEGRTQQRTTVRHIEADTARTWSGIESELLQKWMLDRVSERMQSEPETEQPNPAAKTPVTAEITQLQIVQPPRTGMPMVVNMAGQAFPSSIKSGKSFALEIAFRLAGLNATDIAKQDVRYFAQVYARHRSTGAIAHLGETEPNLLVPNQPFYTAWVPDTILQQSGMYRLQALVSFQGAPVPPAFFEVPLLQVV